MKVSCPSCSSTLNIDDKKIPPGGARIKCPSCQTIFPVKPASAVASSPSGVSISAAAPQRQDWEDEPTRAVPLPSAIPGATMKQAPPSNIGLPRSSSSAAVPLPGITASRPAAQSWEDEATRVASVPPADSGGVDLDLGGASTAVAPAYQPPPSIPLPGAAASKPPGNRSTMMMGGTQSSGSGVVPLPGASARPPSGTRPAVSSGSGAVPLPGSSASQSGVRAAAASGGIPLPGKASSAPPPLPPRGKSSPAIASIPLPGGGDGEGEVSPDQATFIGRSPLGESPEPPTSPRTASIPLPGAADAGGFDLAQTGSAPAIALPGAGGRADQVQDFGGSTQDFGGPPAQDFGASGFDLGDAPPPTEAVELPGSATAAMPPLHGGGEAVELPGSAPAPGEAVQLPGAAGPGFDTGGDFQFDQGASAVGPAGGVEDVPLPGGQDDFSQQPAPAAAPGAFDFAEAAPPGSSSSMAFEAPPPGPAAGGHFDFGEPPPPAPQRAAPAAPADDLAFDFNGPPAPVAPPPAPAAAPAPGPPAPSMGFGEVDIGGGEDLEFDPSAKKAKEDDLEADLSSPLPPGRGAEGPVDGLEMLSFIDQTAKEAGAKTEATATRRFHIKRRSGKTFGPFEDAVIVKMLEEGQLLGNEEVSLDGDAWQAIGSEPTFQPVIARLMEQPARAGTMASMPQVEDKPKGPSMERLKQLYEGRMAAVAVVESKEPFSIKKNLPLIILAVLVLTSGIVGAVLGLATPYGYFGLKVLFPAKVSPDSREATYLAQARKGFLQDNFKSYKAARDQALQALQVKDYPEARAIWCQAVFYLQRHYGDAADLPAAQAELTNVRLLGEKHPEVLKAEAGNALTERDPQRALGFLNDALARQENQDDVELLFLRAEAYLALRQFTQAKTEYEQILKKDAKSARALHGAGLAARAMNDVDQAAARFQEALTVDPDHVSSAVELADIEIVARRDAEKGAKLLEKATSEESKKLLASRELGKALALKAEMLVVANKIADSVPVFEEALKVDPNNDFAKARLGNAYTQMHQPEKALPLFQAASAGSPDNISYAEGYLTSLIALGKMDDATKALEGANQRFPGNANLAYLTGRVADALDKGKDAEEAYKRAIAANPKNTDAFLYLARFYIRFRRFTDARPVLEKGLENDPNNAALRVGMGELAFHERDLERAETEFKKAAELNPNLAEAFLGLSKVALERGKYDLAFSTADKALELNPRVTGGRLQKGTSLWKLNRLDDAVKELETAREDEPRNLQIVVTLGAVEFEKGNLDNALKYLSSALQREPGHPDANFYLARVKNVRAEHTQAIEAMKHALEYNSKSPLYHYWMGRIFLDARKANEAIDEWRAALELEPKYADALEALGHVYFERNELKEAVKAFEQTLEVDPSRSAVRAAIGDTQSKMEAWDQAIASYHKALQADPQIKYAYFRLAQAYQEKKDFKKAIDWYKKATEIEPENADSWLNLGWMFKETKKKKEAMASFRRFLELKPDAENRKEVEDELYFLGQEK